MNHKIRVREVRAIDPEGKQLGVIPTHQALSVAQQHGLDLVEVAPNANPPVCRIMDFGKYKYEQEKREREARRHQHASKVKEIKLRLNIDQHDYDTKLNHVKDFLSEGMKVKISLFFRGRERAHPEYGNSLMKKVELDVEGWGKSESPPRMMGRNMNMILAPAKGAVRKKEQKEHSEEEPQDQD